MKSRSNFRRHQTAYEAPEIDGEFLNESADSMLSVSDSKGNLTSRTFGDIDPSLLEEFNEDQGPARARPIDTPTRATKAIKGASSRSSNDPTARGYDEAVDGHPTQSTQVQTTELAPLVQSNAAQLYELAKAQTIRLASDLKAKPYWLLAGCALSGFLVARMIGTKKS